MRQVTVAEYCHERLGDEFERALSSYDTLRRVETLVDEFLPDSALVGRHALDVGCGLGYFSERLQQRGAHVTGCDIGVNLLERTRARAGCHTVLADALRLLEQFAHGRARRRLALLDVAVHHLPRPGQLPVRRTPQDEVGRLPVQHAERVEGYGLRDDLPHLPRG